MNAATGFSIERICFIHLIYLPPLSTPLSNRLFRFFPHFFSHNTQKFGLICIITFFFSFIRGMHIFQNGFVQCSYQMRRFDIFKANAKWLAFYTCYKCNDSLSLSTVVLGSVYSVFNVLLFRHNNVHYCEDRERKKNISYMCQCTFFAP